MTSDTWNKEDSNLYQHAKRELEFAGLFDADADYDGELAPAILSVVETFCRSGCADSGGTAAISVGVLERVLRYKPLGPITDNPEEWMKVHDGIGGDEMEPLWQCRRQSTLFSHDGGKTYYDLDEPWPDVKSPLIHHSKEHANA